MVNSEPKVLALVPARGGSRSIPRKNVKRFGGHPLIAYSIAAGLQAKSVDRVIVSTDDEEIAEVARSYDAEVPFRRPAELAEDHVTDLPVFEHTLAWLAEHEDYRPDLVVQLRPTSPLRPRGCIDEAVAQLWRHRNADCVRSVTPSGQNPYKMWRIEEGEMSPLLHGEFDEPYNMPRQALPPTYWQTGHIDVIRAATIVNKHTLTGDHILPYVISAGYAVDIDSPEEWEIADWVLGHRDLRFIRPERSPYLMHDVQLLVMGFEGVLTDNKTLFFENGKAAVACSRGDGMGLALVQRQGVKVAVFSEESNGVAQARCEKLGIPCYESISDRAAFFEQLTAEHQLGAEHVIYVGDEVGDLPGLRKAGLGVAVADAHPTVLAKADWVLEARGGHGAVREVCDLILESKRATVSYG